MKYLAAIFILSMPLAFGCNPAKRISKQQKQYQAVVDEYIKNHPVRIDTATKYLQGKDIATTVWRTDTLLNYRTDTVTGLTITDTVFTKGKEIHYLRVDTAVITITQSERITKLENENVQLVQEKDHALLKAAQNKTWLWAFIIACIAAALLLTALLIKTFKK